MSLFDPCVIGGIESRNHFVRSATWRGSADDLGHPTEKTKKILCDLADGGVGVVITSFASVDNYEKALHNMLGIYDDSFIPEYKEIVDAVHALGAKIVMQIAHGSSQSQEDFKTADVLGPSPVRDLKSGVIPREMQYDDIAAVVKLFVAAAVRAKKAGFDGVQLHCAHGYLLSKFISPYYNRRLDEFGGTMKNQVRIIEAILMSIKALLGDDYPVWIKMNSVDELPKGRENGLTVKQFVEMGKILAKKGIDCFEVSGLGWDSHDQKTERAYYLEGARALAFEIDKSVILTGGLREYDMIDKIDKTQGVHYFGFSRPLIKDPSFIKKLQAEAGK
ncbi:MAG: NADH:flavin oxidoreductase [Anaerovoracaceae bacterium]